MKRLILRWLFPDLVKFIQDLYAMPRDPSYFISLPRMPANIKEWTKP